MSQVINTNVASLNAQRNLNASQGQLQTSLQRLSSGLRINSAKDDAAGLAIAERFTAQIRGQNQAIRNANDGISFAQTAEGALTEIGNIAQRVRELAVQSANATNSASDREALNNEVRESIAEINRIAASTQFNGYNLLDNSQDKLTFQIGANAGQTITVDGLDARGRTLGAAVATSLNSGATTGATASDVAAVDAAIFDNFAEGSGVALSGFTITYGGETVGIAGGTVFSMAEVVSKINAETDKTGVLANLSNDGRSIVFSASREAAGGTLSVAAIDIGGITFAAVDLADADNFVTLNKISVKTQEDAAEAMIAIDYVLAEVNGLRADMGAIQNRFESTVSNLAVGAENLSASRSRIQDADFAVETAALTRAQILQQAGTSVLAQANQAPNNVLALLQ